MLQGDEIGVDIDPKARPDVQADGNRLPIRDNAAREVVIQNLVPEAFASGAIQESYRMLKPEGQLTVMTGGQAGSEERAQRIEEIKREMEEAGFKDVSSEREHSSTGHPLDFRYVLRGRKP